MCMYAYMEAMYNYIHRYNYWSLLIATGINMDPEGLIGPLGTKSYMSSYTSGYTYTTKHRAVYTAIHICRCSPIYIYIDMDPNSPLMIPIGINGDQDGLSIQSESKAIHACIYIYTSK